MHIDNLLETTWLTLLMSFEGVTKDIKMKDSPWGKEIQWSKMGGRKYGV